MKNKNLEDFKINVKIKLSLLWATVTFLYIYGDYFELYVPNKISEIINGTSMLDNPMKLFLASVLLAIPSVMVCLSILLKPLLSKWLNIIFGIFFTLLMLLIAVTSIAEEWRGFYAFYAILESVFTATIIWYAFNWSKQTEIN